jgi:hypothetical protein
VPTPLLQPQLHAYHQTTYDVYFEKINISRQKKGYIGSRQGIETLKPEATVMMMMTKTTNKIVSDITQEQLECSASS